MSLLTSFHTALEEHNLKNSTCSFCGVNEATSLAHIIANTKFNNLAIQKRLNVTEAIAQDLLDMPMLNTIYSCPACNGMGFTINGVKSKTCKTQDITSLNEDVVRIAKIIAFKLLYITNDKRELLERRPILKHINELYIIIGKIRIVEDIDELKLLQYDYQNLLIGRWA